MDKIKLQKLKKKKLFLFDIDGVIKLGDNVIDGALDLFNYIDKNGGKSIFITNNSTKSVKSYVEYFSQLGFKVNETNFVTALSISIDYLKQNHKNNKIFVLGTQSLVEELKQNSLNITTVAEPNIDVVLVGYDNELTYQKLVDVCNILQSQNTTYLATNVDLKCPVEFGFIPDCGAITEMIKNVTGFEPNYLGKPTPNMVKKCIESTNFTNDQTLIVGDRLYTDIACGINANVDTCVVFTGEAQPKDIPNCDYEITYAFESVKELLTYLQN